MAINFAAQMQNDYVGTGSTSDNRERAIYLYPLDPGDVDLGPKVHVASQYDGIYVVVPSNAVGVSILAPRQGG